METPFIFGKIATEKNFTDRECVFRSIATQGFQS